MKGRLRRGLALLLTLCLLSGNIAFAAEPPAQSAETSISEEAPTQNGETLPRENETEVPEKNEAEVSEGSTENAPAGHEGELEVAPEHTPETLREGAPEEGEYLFNFSVNRPPYSDFGNMRMIYWGHWMREPREENPVFDFQENNLKDFKITYELHFDDGTTTTKQINCEADNYYWETEILFEDIRMPYSDVEVVYYPAEEGEWVEPYLIHYDLHLKKGNGKMILEVPKLKSATTKVPSGNNQVLKVKYSVRDLNLLYLDGTNGDDGNSGTSPDQAVKTFGRALAIAKENQKIKTITVTGETPIAGEISLAGTSAKIKRADDYNGYLFSISKNAKAILSDIVIDGNKNNKNIANSLIKVESGAILELKKGAHLRNNVISDSTPGFPWEERFTPTRRPLR